MNKKEAIKAMLEGKEVCLSSYPALIYYYNGQDFMVKTNDPKDVSTYKQDINTLCHWGEYELVPEKLYNLEELLPDFREGKIEIQSELWYSASWLNIKNIDRFTLGGNNLCSKWRKRPVER